jgi:urease accessory protein
MAQINPVPTDSSTEPRTNSGSASGSENNDWIIGKHALLDLQIYRGPQRTEVHPVRWRTPYHWLGCHYQDGDDEPFIPLVNTAGGYVEGDRAELHVDIREGARALFTTTGSTKFYKSIAGNTSAERTHVSVGSDALLEYIPDETIPFRKSRVRRDVQISLEKTSRLFLGDILSAGRIHYGDGEVFAFDSLISSTNITVNNRPLVADRIMAVGPQEVEALRRLWHGYHHLVAVSAYAPDFPDGLVDELRSRLRYSGQLAGVSKKGDLISVRVLTTETWRAHEALHEAWSVVRPSLAGKSARVISKP